MLIFSKFFIVFRRRNQGESGIKFKKCEGTLRRIANPQYPQHPKTASEVKVSFSDQSILANFGQNLRKSRPFYIGTEILPKFQFTLFASYGVIELIEKHIPPPQRNYLMDGTFYVRPLGTWYQLLIIYIEYKNSVSFRNNYYGIHPSIHINITDFTYYIISDF